MKSSPLKVSIDGTGTGNRGQMVHLQILDSSFLSMQQQHELWTIVRVLMSALEGSSPSWQEQSSYFTRYQDDSPTTPTVRFGEEAWSFARPWPCLASRSLAGLGRGHKMHEWVFPKTLICWCNSVFSLAPACCTVTSALKRCGTFLG